MAQTFCSYYIALLGGSKITSTLQGSRAWSMSRDVLLQQCSYCSALICSPSDIHPSVECLSIEEEHYRPVDWVSWQCCNVHFWTFIFERCRTVWVLVKIFFFEQSI